jgi:hypothetical protein
LTLAAYAENIEKVTLEIPTKSSRDPLIVEISKVPDLESALLQIEKETHELSSATNIIIANDFNLEETELPEKLRAHPRYDLIPLNLKEKIAATETIQEIEKLYPDKRYEEFPLLVEDHYKKKELSYKKLRTPVTIIKSIGVGVANFALYYSKFDYHFIPAFIWALSTASEAAAFQWKAPEINNDYRIITDAFFKKFSILKPYAVPEFDDGSGRYKIRHRIGKNLGVIFIGGWSVTHLYHFVSTASMFSILAAFNPTTLLNVINEQSSLFGIHFNDLSLQAISVGFLVNQFISSIKELLSDVAPSCLLSSRLQKLSPENKQIAMAIGSALIGGLATTLVSASQFLHYQGIKEVIWTLTITGAGYSTYKYALKDIFSEKFLEEMSSDFNSKIAKKLLTYLKDRKNNLINTQSNQSANKPQPQPQKTKESCRLLLVTSAPKRFLTGGF